jgi:5-hydroxyisourate hydrolase
MISTHILDTSRGCPAQEVEVELAIYSDNQWKILFTEKTNLDGRISFSSNAEKGLYRLRFKIEDYFLKQKIEPFFIVAPVVFNITDVNRKYHIPLLLNPYGYSTYRGS